MEIEDFDIMGFIKEYYPSIKGNTNETNNTYNQIKNLLKKFKNDRNSIFKDFPLKMLDEKGIGKLIYHLRENVSDRQFFSNMKKINVNRNFRDFQIKDEEKISASKRLLKEISNYEAWDIKREMVENGLIIKKYDDRPVEVLKDLLVVNKTIRFVLLDERNLFYSMGLQYRNMNYIEEYIDYVIDGVLQIIDYWIIFNKNLKEKDKIDFFEILEHKIDKLNELFDTQINRSRQNKLNVAIQKSTGYNCEYYTYLCARYIDRRNFYGEYANILKLLKEGEEKEATLFGKVETKYKANEIFINEEETSKIKSIITEGNDVNDYNRKLNEAKDMIDVFRIYGYKEMHKNCLIDLKVFFREIFVDKQSYNKKQSITIVRDFLYKYKKTKNIKVFQKQSENMFIKEKINRGYFREKNALTYYHKKNKLKIKIYSTILKVYLFYKYDDILDFIYEFNNYMLENLDELFSS